MTEIGLLFLLIGLFGLACATFCCPMAAWVLSVSRRRALALNNASRSLSIPLRLEVLVAAHNEETAITQTLQSIVNAVAGVSPSALAAQVTVCLDHCTDNTRAVVESFAACSSLSVRIMENTADRGKWNALNTLAAQSQAEWVAFVDAASIWSTDLLASALASLREPRVVGVAPSYAPQKSGSLERLSWKLEQALKSVESLSGGPTSVHGATVFYRREALARALVELNGTTWLNDDVAIPLTIRLQNPNSQLVYLSEGKASSFVTDAGVRSELGVEFRRRRRMLVGNLQWVSRILFSRPDKDFLVTLVASRRVFRMFWAYWVLFIGLGLASVGLGFIAGSNQILICGALSAVAIGIFAGSNWIRRLAMAFFSGLQLPRYWKEFAKGKGVLWL